MVVRLLIVLFIFVTSNALHAQSRRSQSRFVVDDFSDYEVGKFPGIGTEGWIISSYHFRTEVYTVQIEKGDKFLSAIVSKNIEKKKKASTIIKRVFKSRDEKGNIHFLMPKDYPILKWRWRVHELPQESDERYEDAINGMKSDSAAGVYIYFHKEGQEPQIIKYVWSESLPVGTPPFQSPASKDDFQPYIVIKRSGAGGLGQWIEETANIYEDFKKIYPGKEPPRIVGMGILTDADSTDTSAHADYDDIRLTK
ncbi:MAG: DUF3047 domain-containing protein [Deltaproteobacteria bacterium]